MVNAGKELKSVVKIKILMGQDVSALVTILWSIKSVFYHVDNLPIILMVVAHASLVIPIHHLQEFVLKIKILELSVVPTLRI